MIPVWIAAAAAIVLLGLIVMIGARGRPEDIAARKARRSPDDGGSGFMSDGGAGSGDSCSADAGGGDCGGD